MKKLLFLVILAFFASLVPAGEAKEAAVLLQDARYAEDIEGDIDKAIGLYEKVVQEAGADAKIRAQAMYLQGMCYLKKQDDMEALEVLSKLVAEYPEQAQIVAKARSTIAELSDSDPASLMPPETLLYVEFGSPGKQIETILNMLKGTPLENPLAVLGQGGGGYGGSSGGGGYGGPQNPGQVLNALFNPSMITEFKKIRGMAIGITEIRQDGPAGIVVLYPGKSDALRGMIMAGLGMMGQSAEPIEGMKILNIMGQGGVAYDDTVIVVAHPLELLKKCINQYKGLSTGPSLSDSNKAFAAIGKNIRRQNAVTVWVNVDEAFQSFKQAHGGTLPQDMHPVHTLLDPENIDEFLATVSINEDALNLDANMNFKPGHKCLAYDLFRTPNISRKNFSAVPSDAVALFSFAMNETPRERIERIRKPLERFSGLDLGRGLFNNLEQVTIFVVPNLDTNVSDPMDIPANCVGIALTSKNPAQTRQTWETILGTVSTIGQSESSGQGQPEGRYILPVGRGCQPVYCYLDQYENTTFLSLSDEVIKSAMAARESKSALTNGVLAGPLGKLTPNTSKLAVLNVGGLIKIADAFTTVKHNNPRNPTHKTMQKLAGAFDKSYVRVQTDEKNDSLGIHVSANNIPALKDVFADAMRLSRIDATQKVVATGPQPGNKAVVKFSPSVKLQWQSGAGAASHKVYVGTKADGLEVLAETKKSKSTLTDVKEGENYYWRVDETLADGTVVEGDTWQFNTGGKLVGWWKLDGDVKDSSGNDNHGTAENGPEFIDGAVHLDGGDDYVSLPIGKLISSLTDATFAVWVNIDSTAGYDQWQRIFDFGSDESTYMFLTPRSGYDQEMRFAMTAGSGLGDEDITSAPMTLPADRRHVAVTINTGNNTHTLYLDGKVVAKNTDARYAPSSLGVTTNNWLGRSQYSVDPYLKGSLDDFRIYNYALSEDEVSKLCEGGETQKAVVAEVKDEKKIKVEVEKEVEIEVKKEVEAVQSLDKGLVGWWQLDVDAADSTGHHNHGKIVNGPEWVENGIVGGALRLDGEDDYVELPIGSLIDSLESATFAVWVNVDISAGPWQRIFDFGSDDSTYMFLTPRTEYENQELRFAIAAGGGYTDEDITSAPMALPDGWSHVAVKIDAGNGTHTLYVDGKVVAKKTDARFTPSSLGSTTNNWLGRSQFSPDPYLNGLLDDFRIYNRALSDKEIMALYQIGSSRKAVVPKVKDKEKIKTETTSEVDVKEKVVIVGVAKDNLVGWWKLDGNAKDSSGKGNDGEVMNNPQWIDGKIGGALKFDGADDYVSLPIGSIISKLERSTVMVWVDFSNEGGAWQRIFDFGTDTGNYVYLSPRTDTNGPMRVAITAGEGEWVDLDADSGTLPSGWHHVAVVLEPGNMHLYLDGKVAASTEGWYVLRDLGTTTNNWLGRSQYMSDAYFSGSMDDFRIYNTALTGSQIAEIYKSALNQ